MYYLMYIDPITKVLHMHIYHSYLKMVIMKTLFKVVGKLDIEAGELA